MNWKILLLFQQKIKSSLLIKIVFIIIFDKRELAH